MKKVLIIFITLLLMVAPLTQTACKKEVKGEEKVLASFESYDEIYTMLFNEYYGKIRLSDEHVTHGEKSVFWDVEKSAINIWPIHTENITTMPNILLLPDKVGWDTIDNVDYFAIDVFNAGLSDVFVGVRIVDGNWISVLSNTQIAKKGEQSQLRFYKDDLFPQTKKANIIRLQIMCFSENVNSEGMKLYFDNFRVVTETNKEVSDATLDGNKIVAFDKPEHKKYVHFNTKTDMEVAVKGFKDGNLSLTWLPTRGYTYWSISGMSEKDNKIGLNFYKGLLDLIDLEKVSEFSVDVYNDCIESKKVDFWYVSGGKTYSSTTVVNGRTWTTVSIRVRHIPEEFGINFNMVENITTHDTFIRNLSFTTRGV